MRLKVAAQTTLEPEIAEKPPHPKIVVIAKLPGKQNRTKELNFLLSPS